jgi:two-component system sensor histidine kinase QseC
VPQALTRGQSVELLTEVTPNTWGNPLLWEILWRNLLDNAMRYSPPGAKVRLRIHAGATTPWAITLEDSGPGLSPEALSRLGERFYRGPSTVDAASGSGLGWSIVQQIARSQGLQLELGRSAELGGLRVQLTSSDRRIAPSNGTP